VFIPEYVVTHWWQTLLHNQSALRLKARLLLEPGVISVSVPVLLEPGPGPSTTADDERADMLAPERRAGTLAR
jgi:hypothetical protein